MPRSSSIILIGAGIFVSWLYLFGIVYVGLNEEVEGFPTEGETRYLVNNLSIENIREHHDAAVALVLFFLSLLGIGVGLVVLSSGGIILLYERLRNIKSFVVKKKPVSVTWQVICSFFPGFHLWALYRIKKLRIGIIIDVLGYSSGLLSIYSVLPETNLPSAIFLLESFVFALFVYIWSRDWNKSLQSAKDSKTQDEIIFTGV